MLHERFYTVQAAERDLSTIVYNWKRSHQLTWVEAMHCLLREAAECTRYLLREERHPNNPEKKADEQ